MISNDFKKAHKAYLTYTKGPHGHRNILPTMKCDETMRGAVERLIYITLRLREVSFDGKR